MAINDYWSSQPQSGGDGGYVPSGGGFNFQDFLQQKYNIDQAYGAFQQGGNAYQDFLQQYGGQQQVDNSPWFTQLDDRTMRGRSYRDRGGTYDMYNGQYRDANILDTAAIELGKIGEFWNNLPGQIAGAAGGEQAKQDWTFDASKFDLSNGFDNDDMRQVVNFGASLPGMMVGGVFEGLNKGYEAVTGAPVQEYREKQGGGYEIADYKLDASQRAAAGIDAGINLVGTFTGGAGRVVGGVGKAGAKALLGTEGRQFAKAMAEGGEDAAKRLFPEGAAQYERARKKYNDAMKRQDIIDGMSKGVVTRAFEGTKGAPLGTGAGIVADMGDEAAEEFVQSYADDIRMKQLDEHSFDRALTGAAWGAAGGALMGVGGRALAHVTSIDKAADTEQPDSNEFTLPNNNDFDALRMNATANNAHNRYSSEAVKDFNDYAKSQTRAAASTIYMQTQPDAKLKWDDCELGVEPMIQAFYRDGVDGKSANKIARSLGVTAVDIDRAYRDPNVNFVAYINDLISKSPRGYVQIVIGRNPDTKNGGFKMNLTKVHEGHRFSVRPEVMGLVGSDWDSDRCSVYFDPESLDADIDETTGVALEPRGYASEILVDPETRTSNVEWIWSGISDKTTFNFERFKKIVDKNFKGIAGTYELDGETGLSAGEYFTRKMQNAMAAVDEKGEPDEGARNYGISSVFSEMNQAVEKNRTGQQRRGRTVVNDVLYEALESEPVFIATAGNYYVDAASKVIARSIGLDPSDPQSSKIVADWKKVVSDWEAHGTTGGKTQYGQLAKSIGFLIYLSNPDLKANPIFRQYGGIRYWVNSNETVQEAIKSLANVYGTEDVVMSLLRESYRLAEPGVDPTTAVEGICDTLAMGEIINSLNMVSTGLQSDAEVQAFIKRCYEIQSKYSRIYNESQGQITSQGFQSSYDSMLRNPLDGISRKIGDPDQNFEFAYTGSTDASKEGTEFYAQIGRLFENTLMSNLFSKNIIEKLNIEDMSITLGQFLEMTTSLRTDGDIDAWLAPLKEDFGQAADLLAGFAKAHNASVVRLGKSLMSDEFLSAKWDGMWAKYDATKTIPEEYAPEMLDFMDFVLSLVGPRNASRMGLVLNDALLQSRVGKDLFSGDPSRVMNVIAKASIYGQFSDAINAYASEDPSIRQSGEEELVVLSYVSPLHDVIAKSVLNGNLAVFEWFTSLDNNLKDTIQYFNDTVGAQYSDASFVVNALQTETGRFAISSVSAKKRKAELASSRMRKNSYDAAVGEVKALSDEIEANYTGHYSQSAFVNFVKDTAFSQTVQYQNDIISLQLIAAQKLSNAYVEKATIPEIMAAMYSSAEIATNGTVMSLLNRITSYYSGKSDASDWTQNRMSILSCLVDPNYREWVWDPVQGKNVLVSQEELFRECGITTYDPYNLQYTDIMLVLKKFPHIASYLCKPTTSVSAVGGEMTVKLGRKEEVLDAFHGWVDARTSKSDESLERDSITKYQMDLALGNIKNLLHERINTQAICAAMVDPMLLEGEIDARKISAAVDKAMDDLSTVVFYRVLNGYSNRSENAIKAQRSYSSQNLSEELWNIASLAFESFTIEHGQALGSHMSHELMKTLFEGSLSKNIEDAYGLELNFASAEFPDVGEVAAASAESYMENWKTLNIITTYYMRENLGSALSEYSSLIAQTVDKDSYIAAIADALYRKDRQDIENRKDTFGSDEELARAYRDLTSDENVKKRQERAEEIFDKEKPLSDESIENALSALDISGVFMTVEDFDDEASCADKLNRLMSFDREFALDSECAKRTVENAKNNGTVEKTIEDINARIARHELQKIARSNQLAINENAPQLKQDMDERLEELIKDMVQHVGDHPEYRVFTGNMMKVQKELEYRGLPDFTEPPVLKLHYSSPTTQMVISNITVNAPSSGNPIKVGTNGAMQQYVTPLGFIPKDISDPSFAITRFDTLENVEDLAKRNDMATIRALVNGKIVTVNSKEFKDLTANMAPDQAIEFYHPDDNAHGLPTLNMMEPGIDVNNNYHRLSGIYQRIIMFSMEAMVLKSKKKMQVVEDLVEDRSGRTSTVAGHNQITSNFDYSSLRNHFQNYRRAYVDTLTHDFTDKDNPLISLNFGRDQARIIVQSLTPGMLIDIKTADGTKKVMFDASLFLGDEAQAQARFEEYTKQLQAKYGDFQIVGGEVHSCSFSELSYHAAGIVNGQRDEDGKLSSDQASAAVAKGLNNWSNYGDRCDGSIGSLMSRVRPVGQATNAALPMIDTPVPPSILKSIVSDSAFGTRESARTNARSKTIFLSSNDDARKAAVNIANNLGIDYPVCNVWIQDRQSGGFESDTRRDKNAYDKVLVGKNSVDANGLQKYSGGCGIVYDSKDIIEAIDWGVKTGNTLYVRSSELKYSTAKRYSTDKTINIWGEEFTQINPYNAKRLAALRASQVKSGYSNASRKSIGMTLVIAPDSYIAQQYGLKFADASILLFKSAQDERYNTPFNSDTKSMSQIYSHDNRIGNKKNFIDRDTAKKYLDVLAKNVNGVYMPTEDSVWLNPGNGLPGFDLNGSHIIDNARLKDGDTRDIIKRKIIDYLVDYSTMQDGNKFDPLPSNIGPNMVMGIVMTDTGKAAPYVSPATMPTNIHYAQLDIEGNDVVFRFSGDTSVADANTNGVAKWEINAPYEQFKGVGSICTSKLEDGSDLEPFSTGINGSTQFKYKLAASTETEGSRVAGIDDYLLCDSLYFRMIMEDLSLFYNKTSKGYDLADGIKSWNPDLLDRFINGQMTRDDWMSVAAGINTVLPNNQENRARNDAIGQAIAALVSQDIDPRIFFGSYRLEYARDEDGNIIRNEDGSPKYVRVDYVNTYDGSHDGYQRVAHRTVLNNFLGDLNPMLALFNSVDQKLCPASLQEAATRDRSDYIIGIDGTTKVEFGDGGVDYVLTRYGEPKILGNVIDETAATGESAVSLQHLNARGSDIGYDNDYLAQRAAEYGNLASGRYDDAYEDFLRKTDKSAMKPLKTSFRTSRRTTLDLATMMPTATRQDLKRFQSVMNLDSSTFGNTRFFIDEKGDQISYKEADSSTRYFQAKSSFNRNCDDGKSFTYAMLDNLCKCQTGTTWNDNVKSDKRVWQISENKFFEQVSKIDSNIRDKGLPVVVESVDSADVHNRYPRPLLPRALAVQLWNSRQDLRDHYKETGFNGFVDAMKAEQRRADEAYKNITQNKSSNKSRYIALSDMSRAAWFAWGETSSVLPISGDLSLEQINGDLNSLAAALAGVEGWPPEKVKLFKELVKASDAKINAVRDRLDQLTIKHNDYQVADNSVRVAYTRIDEARDITNILNNAAEVSKIMSVLNPFVTAGNLTDRMICQGTMRASIFLGNKLRLGPYKSQKSHIIPADLRKQAVEDPTGVELYASMRELEFNSEEMLAIQELMESNNIQKVIELARNRRSGSDTLLGKTWGTVKDIAYKSASGGNVGLKNQMGLVLDRFVMFAEATPGQEFWFDPIEDMAREDGTPMTRLDAMLAQPGGFAQFMKFCLSPGSPSYSIFMQAMNSAKRGDMAQKNAVGIVLTDICRRVPFGNFLMTTAVSRFPMYGLNVTGRALNYILPMSSMNRAFTEMMSKTDYGKALGIEESQIHTSMREAMMVDMCKLGVGGCALVLFGLSGAIQPPDDENKWGNVDEWLVFGTRAGENWWVQDILGMALPMACFWKACEQGKPRFDIIVNGVANLCYSNPVVRCGDIASWLMNPAESLISDFNDEVVQYQKAKGGAPDLGQYMQSNAFSLGMNWASQFVTPSIVREWYRASTPLEKSYKRGYKKTATGKVSQEGEEGATEYYTYDEAIKHKMAQRNPVFAWLFSTVTGDDSYIISNMPNTVMYDDYQLAGTKGTSVAGLEGAERQAKVVDIITVLMSYNDMNELAAEGFHLDYETLTAVASQVWDNYHSADEWYNTLQANGQLNYYVLGNGNYDEGMRIAGELKNERDSFKQYWYNFYYEKLKNSPISKQITTYNRYNTTYAMDVNGDVYATGIRRTPYDVLPITTAPGTMTNPEGTAGYENDFATISEVTGLPLSGRALIPTEDGQIELPDFKLFSQDGNGNGYSNQYYSMNGGSAMSDMANLSSSSNKNSTVSSGSRGGSGGGGGSRSGGGGGGGRSGAPNAYAPSVSLPRANTGRIMNTDRVIKPSYDYLRPDFETKGSREAYRRSDI